MASSYDNDLRLNEMATGDQSGAWGTVTNLNLEMIAEAFSYGTRAIANASTDNITLADGASDADRSMYLKLTGGGQACTVSLLPNTVSKVWMIENATSATLTFTQGSGANVAVLAGQVKMIATDGAGSGAVVYDLLTDVNLAGTTHFDNIDVDGTTNLDAVDIDGAVQIDATVNVGVDDTGYDVKFFGDTASAYMQWDASADDLILGGAAGLVVPQDKLTIASTAVTSTAAELNQLDAITRGSILYGNASGATARLAKGAADTVLTSDGTDISWAAAGGAFAASTVTVTANTTLTTAQNGNLILVTASSPVIITLPAAANGLFYVFSSESSVDAFIKTTGSDTINGNGSASKLILAAGASGIVSCGTAGTNWSSVGMTRNMIVHKATTFRNSNVSVNPDRVTGTYTTTIGTQMLICVGSATSGAPYGQLGVGSYKSGGAGGQSYGEKFISSPAASYAYEIAGGGDDSGPSSGSKDKTTTAGGITATQGAEGNQQGSSNLTGLTGGTSSGGTVNFTGGTGGSSGSNNTGGGGGAATRAGAGGNGNSTSNAATYGGGTGGNNASTSAAGAAATARDSNTYAISGSTSETYLAGSAQPNASNANNPGSSSLGHGAGPKTVVNFGSVSFTIADHDQLLVGGVRGANYGGYSKSGQGGYVTFVEFI